MADVLFKCSGCSIHLAVDASGVDTAVDCTACGQKMLVPKPGVSFACPKCRAELAAPPGLAGESFHCTNCEAALVAPTSPTKLPSVKQTLSLKEVPAPTGVPGQTPNAARICPGCGKQMDDDSVICVACGLDLRTGQPLQSAAPRVQAPRLTLKNGAPAGTSGKPVPKTVCQPSRAASADSLRDAEQALERVRGNSQVRRGTPEAGTPSALASTPPADAPPWLRALLDGLDSDLLLKWDKLHTLVKKGTGCQGSVMTKFILEPYISGIRPGTPLGEDFVERTSAAIVLDIGKAGRGDHREAIAHEERERQRKSRPWWKSAPPEAEPYLMDDVGQDAEPDNVTINPRTLEEVGHHRQIEFDSEVRRRFGTQPPWLFPETILHGGFLLCLIRVAATREFSDDDGPSDLAFRSIAPSLHERIHEKLVSLIRQAAKARHLL